MACAFSFGRVLWGGELDKWLKVGFFTSLLSLLPPLSGVLLSGVVVNDEGPLFVVGVITSTKLSGKTPI